MDNFLQVALAGCDVVSGPEVTQMLRAANGGTAPGPVKVANLLRAAGFYRVDPPMSRAMRQWLDDEPDRAAPDSSRTWSVPGIGIVPVYVRDPMSDATQRVARAWADARQRAEESRTLPRKAMLERMAWDDLRQLAVRQWIDAKRLEWRRTHPAARSGRKPGTAAIERALADKRRAIAASVALAQGFRPHASDLAERAAARRKLRGVSVTRAAQLARDALDNAPQVPPVPLIG